MSLARWFPLVPRPRPPGRGLADRVEAIRRDAAVARDGSGQEALAAASRVYNGAALIASDTGHQHLARTWCWEHAGRYLAHLPLSGTMAQRALEPVVNLARLQIRAGNGEEAFAMLAALYEGVRARRAQVIDGHELALDRFTASEADRGELYRWLWTVFLGDGLRALVSAGQWEAAATQAQQHGGIGDRLFDGRQVVIVAHLLAGHANRALAVAEESAAPEPWEEALKQVLSVWCRGEISNITRLQAQNLERLVGPVLDAKHPLFSARLGIAAVHLLRRAGTETADLTGLVITTVLQAQDGYAARDLLGWWTDTVTAGQRKELSKVLDASGLGAAELPDPLRRHLDEAVTTAALLLHKTGLPAVSELPFLTDASSLWNIHESHRRRSSQGFFPGLLSMGRTGSERLFKLV